MRALMLLMVAGFLPDFMAGFTGGRGRYGNAKHAAGKKGGRDQDRRYPSPEGLHTR